MLRRNRRTSITTKYYTKFNISDAREPEVAGKETLAENDNDSLNDSTQETIDILTYLAMNTEIENGNGAIDKQSEVYENENDTVKHKITDYFKKINGERVGAKQQDTWCNVISDREAKAFESVKGTLNESVTSGV